MYRLLFDVVFRRMDPERAHELSFGLIRGVARVPVLRGLVARVFADHYAPVADKRNPDGARAERALTSTSVGQVKTRAFDLLRTA